RELSRGGRNVRFLGASTSLYLSKPELQRELNSKRREHRIRKLLWCTWIRGVRTWTRESICESKLVGGYSILSSIKHIVELGPEFDLLALADREKLIERKVNV